MLMETVLNLITKPTKLHLPSTSRSSRRASKAAVSTWTELKKRPEVSLHKESTRSDCRSTLGYSRYVPGISQSLSASTIASVGDRLTSGRFLSSVHLDTAALLARLEDRLVLGRCSFVGLVITTQATPSAIGITRNNRTNAVFEIIFIV